MSQLPPTANTPLTHSENNTFYPALDGLRGVAFLMVFGVHYLSLAWAASGVNVFFVLSGFLITGILFDSRDDRFRVYNFIFVAPCVSSHCSMAFSSSCLCRRPFYTGGGTATGCSGPCTSRTFFISPHLLLRYRILPFSLQPMGI